MMVAVDNNFLIKLVDDKSAYRLYHQLMERKDISLALPTPVLAEFLVRDDNLERMTFLSQVNPFLQIFDFDIKSARTSAIVMRNLIAKDYFKNKGKEKRIIKVDIQIIGITLANQIPQLYTTDKEIPKIISLLDLPIEIIDFEKEEHKGMSLFETPE